MEIADHFAPGHLEDEFRRHNSNCFTLCKPFQQLGNLIVYLRQAGNIIFNILPVFHRVNFGKQRVQIEMVTSYEMMDRILMIPELMPSHGIFQIPAIDIIGNLLLCS